MNLPVRWALGLAAAVAMLVPSVAAAKPKKHHRSPPRPKAGALYRGHVDLGSFGNEKPDIAPLEFRLAKDGKTNVAARLFRVGLVDELRRTVPGLL